MNKEIQNIIKELDECISKKRLRHSIGVMYTAGCMAMRYNVSVDNAYYAGILHDCAKEYTDNELLKICKKNNVPVSDFEKENAFLLHGKAGACLAAKRYGITDENILNPIKYHTTGRVAMSVPEQIIFIADYIEPNRAMFDGLEEIRHMAFVDLDKACAMVIDNCINYIKSTGRLKLGEDTIKTYDYYKQYL